MSLLSSDKNIFEYRQELNDGYAEVEWTYVHRKRDKLFLRGPVISEVELVSETGGEESSVERRHVLKDGTMSESHYFSSVEKQDQEGRLNLDELAEIEPKTTTCKNVSRLLDGVLIEGHAREEIDDGERLSASTENNEFSGYIEKQNGEITYRISGSLTVGEEPMFFMRKIINSLSK